MTISSAVFVLMFHQKMSSFEEYGYTFRGDYFGKIGLFLNCLAWESLKNSSAFQLKERVERINATSWEKIKITHNLPLLLKEKNTVYKVGFLPFTSHLKQIMLFTKLFLLVDKLVYQLFTLFFSRSARSINLVKLILWN